VVVKIIANTLENLMNSFVEWRFELKTDLAVMLP